MIKKISTSKKNTQLDNFGSFSNLGMVYHFNAFAKIVQNFEDLAFTECNKLL